jgi:hypothetical protein
MQFQKGKSQAVIPAKAGIQGSNGFLKNSLTASTPAFAGETPKSHD